MTKLDQQIMSCKLNEKSQKFLSVFEKYSLIENHQLNNYFKEFSLVSILFFILFL